MQIPESIEKLTSEVSADPFIKKETVSTLDIDDIVLTIKKTLDNQTLHDFETGTNFYKVNTATDKHIIKNYLSLFSEVLCSAVKNKNSIENGAEVISSIKMFFDGLKLNFESFYNNLTFLSKGNNLLDARNLTYIILGYALTLIKKIHYSRNEE